MIPSQTQIDEAAVSLAKERFLPFVILNEPAFVRGEHLKKIAAKLEAVERGEIKRLIITLPPRHGKSLLCSQYFPAWYLGRNPKKYIITATYSDELSKDFGRKVRNLMQSQEYSKVFSTLLSEDSAAKNRFNTNEEGSYIATGVGGSITGRGANVLLIDDPIKNQEEADSMLMRNKIWDWYTSVALTRLMPDGAIVVIMTRWHKDDLAGRLIKQGGFDVVHLPAIDDSNTPLWPGFWPLEMLEKKRDEVGPRVWQCLYQGVPGDPEKQIFFPEMFRYYDNPPEKPLVILAIDPAFTDTSKSDYTAIMVVGVLDNKYYILDYIAERTKEVSAFGDLAIRMLRKWTPSYWGMEAVAAQAFIGQYLKERLQKEKIPIGNYQEIRQNKSKEIKIKILEPYIRDGRLLWKRHHTELEKQLIEFPQGDHDDIIDALQMCFEINPLAGVYTSPNTKSQALNLKAIKYDKFGRPVLT